MKDFVTLLLFAFVVAGALAWVANLIASLIRAMFSGNENDL